MVFKFRSNLLFDQKEEIADQLSTFTNEIINLQELSELVQLVAFSAETIENSSNRKGSFPKAPKSPQYSI